MQRRQRDASSAGPAVANSARKINPIRCEHREFGGSPCVCVLERERRRKKQSKGTKSFSVKRRCCSKQQLQ